MALADYCITAGHKGAFGALERSNPKSGTVKPENRNGFSAGITE